jgi:class 3 adenylate cyclase
MQDETLPGHDQPPMLERRLATIMMADVAGYSRMMGENEERTVQTLRGHREIFDALLGLHRGRIFNTAGDSILAEFPSAVQAVRCATEIQAALRTRNEHLPAEQRMWFRVGINLGDVIVQGGDLLGDGVNVAARIQTIAEPGGICISGSVYDQIQNKLSLRFTLMGERSFKNIAQPIRTFSIVDADDAGGFVAVPPERTMRKKVTAIAAAVVAIIIAVCTGYWIYHDSEAHRAEEIRRTVAAERQVAEAERKANEEKLAAEARQLQAAEAERKANEERQAAEARQRQVKLEAEAVAAKEALQRAEAEKKRLDQELKRVTAERRTAVSAGQEALPGSAQGASVVQPKGPEAQRAAKVPDTSPGTRDVSALNRFDGSYKGQLCNAVPGSETEKKCWPAPLKVEAGKILATWASQVAGKSSYVKGTVSTDGIVSVTLEGWRPNGTPAHGAMAGAWSDNIISASGTWANGLRVTGTWRRVP